MGEELKKNLLQHQNTSEEEPLRSRVWQESKKIWIVAGPAIFNRFSTFGITVVSQSFIGHIGPTELAAYAIVMTVLVRFANGILLGMASALETICGQAYGAKQYDMLGVHLQRSWIVMFLTSILLLPIYIFTIPILEALGQDKNIAIASGSISLWSMGIVFAFSVSFTCQMFLQAQSKNKIIAYLAAVSIAIHVFLSWLLTVKFKFRLNGAMTSILLAYWIPNIGQLIYIMKKCPDTWKGFSFLAFKDLWAVTKLSLSSGAMLCLEIWYPTILVLLTGNMKNAEIFVDALSICMNINGWEMMITLGLCAAASVRVSNELGRGNSEGAKFSIVILVLTSFAIGFVLFWFFLFLKERLAYIFTPNPDVANAVGDLSPLLAVSILLNSIQPVLSGYGVSVANQIGVIFCYCLIVINIFGVSVGAGWQKFVAYVNIGSYYLIGIPVGLLIGHYLHLQVKGVWIGMLLGIFVQTVVLIIITYKTDWDNQVVIARNRVNKWSVVEKDESIDPKNLS